MRKSFEVAVHGGAAAALLIGQRQTILEELRAFDGRRALTLGLSFLPAALVGYVLERPIEQRLGGPKRDGDRAAGGSGGDARRRHTAAAARSRRRDAG